MIYLIWFEKIYYIMGRINLNIFGCQYPLLEKSEILPVQKITEKNLIDAIRLLENIHKIELQYVCLRDHKVIKSMENSCIDNDFRKLIHCDERVKILENEQLTNEFSESLKAIVEIANCYSHKIGENREVYRYNFLTLSKLVLDYFSIHSKVDCLDSLLIIPLRAAKIMADATEDNMLKNIKKYPVHMKRIYYCDDNVAVGFEKVNKEDFSTNKNLIILEGGIVSGVTIVSFLELLSYFGVLPKQINVCAVHAALYGIFNILNYCNNNNVEIKLWAGLTSYCIGEKLYSFFDFNPWKYGALVTGDIGDYTEISNSQK